MITASVFFSIFNGSAPSIVDSQIVATCVNTAVESEQLKNLRTPYRLRCLIQLPQLSRVVMCPLGEGNKLHALHSVTADAGLTFSFKVLLRRFMSPCVLQANQYH